MNQRELDVLNILWSTEEPMMATDIVNAGDGSLTQSTVTAVLRVLLRTECVKVVGIKHSGKVLSRTYRPTEKAKEAVLGEFKKLYETCKSVVKPEEVMKVVLEAAGKEE